MRRAIAILGWMGMFAAVGVAVWQVREADELRRKTAMLEEQARALHEDLAKKSDELITLREELQKRDEHAQATAPSENESASGGGLFSQLAASLLKSKSGEASDEKTKSPFVSVMDQMMKGDTLKSFAGMGAEMAVASEYGGLFKDLQLTPEREQQLREILSRHARSQMEEMFDSVGKGFSVEKLLNGEMANDPEMKRKVEAISKRRDEIEAARRNELASVLSADELAMYDDYEEHKTERLQEERYKEELGRFASGLTPEGQSRAIEVLIEESSISDMKKDDNKAFSRENLDSFADQQMAGINRARERLAQELDADQLAAFDRFVEQQQRENEMMRSMMSTFKGIFPSPDKKK